MKSICNFAYARTRQGSSRFPNVKGLLRYLQFRDNRDQHIPGAGGPDRWVDGGLGTHYRAILSRLDELSPSNRHAYCHAIVISPDPEAMANVEGDPSPEGDLRKERFVEAVQVALEEWEMWRLEHDQKPQIGAIEYSFVVHRPQREYGEQMHAHVILGAATEHPMTRERTPLYNGQPEIEGFKEIVYRQLDRVFELDRERERPEPEPELALDLQPEIPGLDMDISFHGR
jgi:hypothetical protein